MGERLCPWQHFIRTSSCATCWCRLRVLAGHAQGTRSKRTESQLTASVNLRGPRRETPHHASTFVPSAAKSVDGASLQTSPAGVSASCAEVVEQHSDSPRVTWRTYDDTGGRRTGWSFRNPSDVARCHGYRCSRSGQTTCRALNSCPWWYQMAVPRYASIVGKGRNVQT